ncbi:MAG: Bsp6I family type II restriction endonuclease [Methanobacteriaceae archaeon]
MLTEIKKLVLSEKEYDVEVDIFDKSDKDSLIEMYDMWAELSTRLNSYGCRKVNFPEISEIFFCLTFDCWRVNNAKGAGGEHTSFDCYNHKTEKTIQVKSAGAKNELTSFGPTSEWDELYFMDFYNDGNYDGTFEVYLIPNDDVYNVKVNKNETFAEKQKTGQRPRFSIRKKIINPQNLEPLGKFNIHDL